MKIYVNGVEIYYEEKGQENEKTLVMVHGNGEDHTIFDQAVEVLSQTFRCIVVDSRGHGHSTMVEELHYEDMASDMIAFMEALELRDIIFYGFSDGGIIGLLAAAKSDRISELIVSGANVTPTGVKARIGIMTLISYILHRDPKEKLMLTEPHITKQDLSKIKARTLVLAGSKDLIREKETRFIAQNIKNSELLILEGETHGSYIVHSEKIADEIMRFMIEYE